MSRATEERLAAARRRAGAHTAARNHGKVLDAYERRVDIRSALMAEDAMLARMGRPSSRMREVG